MIETQLVEQLNAFLIAAVVFAGPPLGAATLLGLIVALFQAVTQIQDQTLAQTVKIVIVVAVFLTMGGLLAGPLVEATALVFDGFVDIVR